jgi:hypothetical protein
MECPPQPPHGDRNDGNHHPSTMTTTVDRGGHTNNNGKYNITGDRTMGQQQ